MFNEKRMIRDMKNGDETAFESLVYSYERKIYTMAYRSCLNEQDALDITQEVFLRVYRSIGTFKEESSFSTWIYRIANNVCIDHARRASRHHTVSLYQETEDGEREIDIVDDAPTPEELQYKKEEHAEIERAIAELSLEHREIVMLRDILGLSYDEIAEVLQLNVGTVKSRIARARANLVENLRKGNFFDELKSKPKEGGADSAEL